RVAQMDDPATLYAKPKSVAVATFLGSGSLIAGEIAEVRQDRTGIVATLDGTGRLEVVLPDGSRTGERVDVAVRAEGLTLQTADPGRDRNVLPGTLVRLSFQGGA